MNCCMFVNKVLELAGNKARDNKDEQVNPEASAFVCEEREELGNGKLLAGVINAHGGVLPNINHVLLPKKSEKAGRVPKSPSKATKSPQKA